MKSAANFGDLVEIHFGKIYKERIINNINMFPSDISGSLDVLFLNYKFIKYFGKNYGRNISIY